MKFHWFHLMPYPYLPDDFKREVPLACGSILPAGELYDPVKGHQVYNDYLDQLEFAEQLRLRRHLRQRAPPERLRPDAVAEPDGGGAGAADVEAPSSSCSATRSRSTIRRPASPRRWRCST